MDILEKMEKLIGEYKDLEPGALALSTTFEELQLDSLDTVDLVMACEEEFGVTIEMSEELKTVGDIVALIEENARA